MSTLKEITNTIAYATVATADADGQPWNSPVSALHDEALNYYWASDKNSQHSRNIHDNPNVFIVVYDSTAPEGTGEGVYIKARAEEVTNAQAVEGILALRAQSKSSNRDVAEFLGESPRRFYKAIPEKIWMNDDGEVDGMYIDIRREVQIS